MNAVLNKLPALVQEEKAAANQVHGPFASLHEGYAVLLEEVTETAEALNQVQYHTDQLWEAIRGDADHLADMAAARIEGWAVSVAAEALQVAAMAQKLQDYGRSDRNE